MRRATHHTAPGWGKRDLAVKAAEAQATQADAMRDASWAELAANRDAVVALLRGRPGARPLNREGLTLLQGLENSAWLVTSWVCCRSRRCLRIQREITAQRLALVEVEQAQGPGPRD